jgi:membrane protease YdiL (CAAX protease family)
MKQSIKLRNRPKQTLILIGLARLKNCNLHSEIMRNSALNAENFYTKACWLEASLLLVALVLSWLADLNPVADWHFTEKGWLYGILGTAPLLLLFFALEQAAFPAVTQIRELLLNTLAPGLVKKHWSDLLTLAAIAGISEEVLFRGVIQPWLTAHWTPIIALLGANLLFGLAHAVTPLYALLAMLVGVYLSLSMQVEGDTNLLIPIVIHGLYDFFALWALLKLYRHRQAD